jgi:hypothetical protein
MNLMETTIATRFVTRLSVEDQALAYMAHGPISVREALAIGGNALVQALCRLTKRAKPVATYSAGAFRPVPQEVR